MGIFDKIKAALSGEPQRHGYYLIGADKKEYGPYSQTDIIDFLEEGRVGWDTMIRQGVTGNYTELCNHPDFPNTPSPPPIMGEAKKHKKQPKPSKKKTPKKQGYKAPDASKTIVIEYLNYAGDLKQFIGDPKSIRRRGNHFSVRVAPTFKRISLNRSKTRILKGVSAPTELPKEPLPVQTTTSDTSIIQYTNWKGEKKEFKIITGVVDDKGDFVRVRVSPTFQYITLKRKRIGNPNALFEKTNLTGHAGTQEVNPLEADPTANEEQSAAVASESEKVSIILTGCSLGTYDATKAIQEIRPDLGTFDIYTLLRDFPNTIAENLDLNTALNHKKRLEDAGCTVELK